MAARSWGDCPLVGARPASQGGRQPTTGDLTGRSKGVGLSPIVQVMVGWVSVDFQVWVSVGAVYQAILSQSARSAGRV
jgi:hypothetical protein